MLAYNGADCGQAWTLFFNKRELMSCTHSSSGPLFSYQAISLVCTDYATCFGGIFDRQQALRIRRVGQEPYICTMYNRIFGDFPAKNITHTTCSGIYVYTGSITNVYQSIPECTQGWPELYIFAVFDRIFSCLKYRVHIVSLW
jgi:hypothetical protein